jgi:cytochrome b pre-mRNA-processing protein 3
MSILDLFRGKRFSDQALALYGAVVAQSRQPGFYRDLGVPDTPLGRFEMVVLHAFLLLHRLRDDGEAADLAQEVFDLMFADFDQNLREMGVGDLSVGPRIKRLAQGFYGRARAYQAGLESPEATVLTGALARNLFGGAATDEARLAAVAGYMRRASAGLAGQSLAELGAGRVAFGPPPAPVA